MSEKKVWLDKETRELIDVYRDYRSLWDTTHPDFRNRSRRQEAIDCLAWKFETDANEIARKLHNLRTQYLQQLKKLKIRHEAEGTTDAKCTWPYFNSLTFIQPTRGASQSSHDATVDVNVTSSLILEDPLSLPDDHSSVDEPPVKKLRQEIMKGEPERAITKPEQHQQQESSSSTSQGSDPDQIFGDYVASELRQIRSLANKRKLKRLINEALIQVGELEDQAENDLNHTQLDVKPELSRIFKENRRS